jgi:IS5 family transposase
MCVVTLRELRRAIVDTAVQEKVIAYPADSHLLEVARQKQRTIVRQSYEREGPKLQRCAREHAYAKHFKRLNVVRLRQGTILGRLIRDIEPKTVDATATSALRMMLERAEELRNQHRRAKNKLHALHTPEVECFSKGKSRQPYEFGVKVGIAITATGVLINGTRSFPVNPYDGDTLAEQLEQAEILSGEKPWTKFVDLGYRGSTVVRVENLHYGTPEQLARHQWFLVRRRQALEAVLRNSTDDCRLRRNSFKGALGEALHVLSCAAGYNLHWSLRRIAFFWTSILGLFIGIYGLPNREIRLQTA